MRKPVPPSSRSRSWRGRCRPPAGETTTSHTPAAAAGRPQTRAAACGAPPARRTCAARRASEPPRVFDDQRIVVAEAARLVHLATTRTRRQCRGGDLVIDAPPDVVGPGLAAIAPPGIAFAGRVRVQPPVHVDPSELVEGASDPGALLGKKARVLLVRAPVFQVDLPVRDVHVAAQQVLAPAVAQLL